jgi:ketosteroid isomerase-like protein
VEVVRAVYEAWNTGDMNAFRELFHHDAIMRMAEGWPEPGPYFGRDAVMRECGQLREAWNADSMELTSDFIDVADHVAVRQIWRGVGLGPQTDLELTNVVTVRRGKVIYQEFFWDHQEALEVVGLRE